MPRTTPPFPLHLSPRRREAFGQTLPAKVRLALALDHLRLVHPEMVGPKAERAIDEGMTAITSLLEPEPWLQEVEHLESLPIEDRAEEIQQAPGERLSSPEFLRALGRKAIQALPGDPGASLHWAELCGLVARRGSTPEHVEWRAHWLYLTANAYRAHQDFQEAQRWFDLAASQARTTRTVTCWIAAERNKLLSSWLLDRRQIKRALTAAERSAALADQNGQPDRQGRAALVAGHVHFQAGKYRRAVAHHKVAVDCYEPAEAHPMPAMMARFNLATAWSEAGVHGAGRTALLRAKKLFELFSDNRYVQLRKRWREAKIAAGLGERDAALKAYRETIEGFLDTGTPLDATHATLHLATFLRTLPDLDALREVSREFVPRLEAAMPEYAEPDLEAVLRILGQAGRDAAGVRLRDLVRAGRRLEGSVFAETDESSDSS